MRYINISRNVDQELAQRLLATNFLGTVLAGSPEDEDNYSYGIVISEDKKSFASKEIPAADDTETNGISTVQSYKLDGCTIFIESGENDGLHIYPPNTSIARFVGEWDTGDIDLPEFLAEWGFDATPDKAQEGVTDVRIWCEPNYYAGTSGAPVGHYVDATEIDSSNGRHNSGEHAKFATIEDAQAWIDAQEEGIYCTAHGEAGWPSYTICE